MPQRGHGQSAVIRGLSASTNRQIAQFEKDNGLNQGDVAFSFHRWVRAGNRPSQGKDLWDGYSVNHGCHRGYYPHVRTLLEHAICSLRKKASRELRQAVEPLDDRVLARTLNDPFAPADLPWWQRRFETGPE